MDKLLFEVASERSRGAGFFTGAAQSSPPHLSRSRPC